MKTIIITITILLSVTLAGRTQYVYWNEIALQPSNLMNTGSNSMKLQDQAYLNLGFYLDNVIDTMGVYWNRLSLDGGLLEEGFTPLPYITYIAGIIPHACYLHLSDGHYFVNRATGNGLGDFYPYFILLDENMDTVWTKLYTSQPTPVHNDTYDPFGTIELDNNEFLTLTTACDSCIYSNNGFRFIRMNTLGETLSDTQWASDNHWHAFHVNGLTRYGADSLLFWGSVVHFAPGAESQDHDVFIAKSDLAGGGLQWTQIGNSNLCDEFYPDAIEMDNGHLLFMYNKCVWQDEIIFYHRMTEMHALEVDAADMSFVNDIALDLGSIDDDLMYGINMSRMLKIPYGGYLAAFTYTEPNTNQHVYLIKLNEDLQIDWLHDYWSFHAGDPLANTRKILDMINAPDGGFVCTGMAEYPDPWPVQRSWTFKIDACGYEQPMGCAAVIGVDEKQNNNVAIWPNPFRGELKAILPKSAKRVFITDLTGRCVHEEKVYYPNQQWNFSSLSDGIYMLNVEVENGEVIGKKIIKQ